MAIVSNIGAYFKDISAKTSKTLYVSLESNLISSPENLNISKIPINDLINVVPKIYVEAHKHAPQLDVRVLHHWCYRNNDRFSKLKRKLFFNPQVIFSNGSFTENQLVAYMNLNFDIQLQSMEVVTLENLPSNATILNEKINNQVYDYVCIGGTFDNLHNGHKILISTAQLKCQKALTIGVTDENMIRQKTLSDLIESPEKRMNELLLYCKDVDPYIEYKISVIQDPYGPSIVDSSLQNLVASEETERGAKKINEIRLNKKMALLDIDIVKLLEENLDHKKLEDKVSSSFLRFKKLGSLIKEPDIKPDLPDQPYLIGLTGVIASGKTSISSKLQQLGAGVINMDLLAHQTYSDSALPAFSEIVKQFGSKILNEKGLIDRKKLGEIVFKDKNKLNMLNAIIWPETLMLAQKEIDRLKTKHKVIVLEIALLIEAQLMDSVHQVWLTILDEKEACRRLMDRNQLNEEQAMQRIRSMLSTREKIKHANVVFCTLWEPEVTWEQVRQAWKMLNDRFIN